MLSIILMVPKRLSFMKNKIDKTLSGSNFWLFIVIFISLLPLTPLLHSGIFAGHDTPDHVARIANFYQNLSEGTLIPRWAGNLNWGYGHPILMFLYPLPSYVASFFMMLGLSVVAATKIVFAIGFVGSGITIFLWVRKMLGDKAGFIAATFYLFAPYRFVDLYVRGAIGENFFFVFPPLICYFLIKLRETKHITYIPLTAIAIAGMVLSHNALAIMFLPFVALYGAILIFQEKNRVRTAIYMVSSAILGFGLSAFFLIPAFLEGKYTLRDIVTKNEIFNRFETFSRLLYSSWDYGGSGHMSVQVGIGHWLAVLVSTIGVVVYLLNKKAAKKLSPMPVEHVYVLTSSLVFFLLSIFLMLPVSKPIYVAITILQKFQFPWRFLSLSVFTSSILAGFAVSVLFPKKHNIVIMIGLIALLISIPFWQPKGFIEKELSFYTNVYPGTTDTGESAPVWSVRFMEKEPDTHAEIVEGLGSIQPGSRTSTKHIYTVESSSEKVRIRENTLYFPGWKVFVDNKEIPISGIFFQDPNYRGLINFFIDSPGTHEVVVAFTETKLRFLSNLISAVSVIVVVVLLVYVKK